MFTYFKEITMKIQKSKQKLGKQVEGFEEHGFIAKLQKSIKDAQKGIDSINKLSLEAPRDKSELYFSEIETDEKLELLNRYNL